MFFVYPCEPAWYLVSEAFSVSIFLVKKNNNWVKSVTFCYLNRDYKMLVFGLNFSIHCDVISCFFMVRIFPSLFL